MTAEQPAAGADWPLPGPPHVLREYALLADGERGALVDPQGEIAWLCAPHWDSDAVFCSLLGGAGGYLVSPVQRYVWGGSYEPGSLVWHSRWVTGSGIVECHEALAFPGDPHRVVILRQIHARHAPARMDVVLEPAAGFGRDPLQDLHRDDGGGWHGRAGALRMRWSGAPDARPRGDGRGLRATLEVPEGGRHDLVLELAERPFDGDPVDPATAWAATRAAWRQAVPPIDASIAPRDARHAYTVMRGLTGRGGGMVAAATTSLPERARQGRNYDYRYVWIRDLCYAGQAVAAAGPHPLLDDAVRFVTDRLLDAGPHLAPAYTTSGDPVPDQHGVDLPGYPGGGAVLGNRANHQFQLDAYGEALLLLASAARWGRIDADGYAAIAAASAAIEKRWREPDAGIWELDQLRWAHSRLCCAAGLRAVASAVGGGRAGTRWNALADTIVADSSDCLHPSGRWQRAPDDPGVDASLLLPPVRGALPATDPRTVATVRAVIDELTDDGYVYRFRHDNRRLGDAEGAFILCGFQLALATHQQGDPIGAARWFERSRAACGPPALFAEEYDVDQRQLRGNLPQAFVHALLLESSVRIGRPGGSEGNPG